MSQGPRPRNLGRICPPEAPFLLSLVKKSLLSSVARLAAPVPTVNGQVPPRPHGHRRNRNSWACHGARPCAAFPIAMRADASRSRHHRVSCNIRSAHPTRPVRGCRDPRQPCPGYASSSTLSNAHTPKSPEHPPELHPCPAESPGPCSVSCPAPRSTDACRASRVPGTPAGSRSNRWKTAWCSALTS